MKSVVAVTGPGQIGQAIDRRVGIGKQVRWPIEGHATLTGTKACQLQ